MKKISSIILRKIEYLCTCSVTTDSIDKASFHCFHPSSNFVTYRAQLSGTPSTDSRTLLLYIKNWVLLGPSIAVQGVLLTVDSECPVSIASMEDGGCNMTLVSSSSTHSIAVIIGGVVGGATALVLIIAVLLWVMKVSCSLLKSHRENTPVLQFQR